MDHSDISGPIFIYRSFEDRQFAEKLIYHLERSLASKDSIILTMDDRLWPNWLWQPWREDMEWRHWEPWLGISGRGEYQLLKDYLERTPLLERKAIILFLLSPDSSHWLIRQLRDLELIQQNAEKFRYISILVRPVIEEAGAFKTVFPQVQQFPSNGQAVTTWSNHDAAWADVARGICAVVEEFLYGKIPVYSGSIGSSSNTVAFLAEYLFHRLPLRPFWQNLLRHFRSLGMSLLIRRRTFPLVLGRYEKALQDYERVLLAKPDQLDLHIGRGKALLGLKRSQEALDTFNTALRLDPKSVEAFKGQGKAYEQLAQHVFEDLNRQAEECYEQAKQLGVEEI